MQPESVKPNLQIEHLPYAFARHQIVTDSKGKPVDYIFIELNAAFEEMTGLKRSELLGKRITAVQPGIVKSNFDWIGTYDQIALSGKAIRFENYSETLKRWFDVNAYCDEPGYFCVIFRDTTEQKQLEKEITESRLLLQSVVNTQQEMVSRYLPDTTLIFVNDAYCRIFGIERQEILGRKFLEFIPSVLHANIIELIYGLTPDEPSVTHEHQAVLSDGSIRWQEWTEHALFTESGVIKELQGVGRDTTERKQTQEALLKSEKEFRATFELASVGIVQVDPQNGQIIRYNKTFRDIVGYSDQALRKTNFPALTHPEDRLSDWEIFSRAARGETPNYQNEKRYIRKDGSVIWVRLNAAFIRDDNGNPIRTIAICEDITDRKKAEKALILQAKERAAVDSFTYSVSNDLQAPLRRIEGFGEALLEECSDLLDLQARDYLNRIIHQISSMKALTDALLRLSRVVRRSVEREKVDLSGLVRSHMEKLSYKEPGREVEMVVAPDLTAEGDTELLSVALENLLENAWKFSSKKAKARIEFGSRPQEGNIIYYVSDNGAGFNMEHADKLFTPFQKLHGDDDYPGIGIGLNIVYRIIARHGGEVWAEGAEDIGATFFFTLP